MLSASLMKRNVAHCTHLYRRDVRRFFLVPQSIVLSRVIVVGCHLLAPIPRPAIILDSRWASRAFPFCTAPLICSPTIRFLSFSCLVFAEFWADRETASSLCWSVALPALLLGARHIRGDTPSLLRLPSFHSSFCLEKLRHLCLASDDPFLLILRSSSGLEGFHRARHCLDEEVVDCIGRLLGIHDGERTSTCSPRARAPQRLSLPAFFSIQPSSTHTWPVLTMLALLSLFLVLSTFERLLSRESDHACGCSFRVAIGLPV